MQFRCISDSAVACDGGSLALLLVRTDGSRASLVLDRSIKSRGTPAFGTVRVDGVLVSGSAASELSTELQRLNEGLSPDDRSKHSVSPFVEALRRQGAAPHPTAVERLEGLDIGPRPADAAAGPVWRELVGPDRIVTLGEAVELAERALSASDMGVLAVQEFDFGWVMALQGRRYLATRAFLDQLVGHGLTIVERATGDVYCSGSASPGWAAVLGYFRARAKHRGGPNTFALPSPADRHRSLSYEHLPGFGDYIYGDGTRSWTQGREDAVGRPLLLRGRSRRPTPEQIALFERIDADIERLSAAAVAAVQPPHPDHFLAVPAAPMFVRQDLTLREVRLEDDGTFVLFFDSPTGDAINVWPMVIFRDWSVESAGWVP